MNLIELVEANKRGRSLRTLMDYSGGYITDRNYFMPGTMKNAKGLPSPDKIRGLSAALEVSPLAVILASADLLGILEYTPGQALDDDQEQRSELRADRLQAERDTERETVRALRLQVSRLKSKVAVMAERDAPSPLPSDSEAEYWRDHAMRYRERLARYEGLRPLPRRHHTHQQLTSANPN